MINAAVLGYGTVGSGVVEVLEDNGSSIEARSGVSIHVKYILDLREFPGDKYEDRLTHDVQDILQDESVKIVCETMGGVGAAYAFTKQALQAGKCVCTSNKELVAKHGLELLGIAAANNCSYLFEASVGGGIPLIRTINESLTAEQILSIAGILNGTTNYILTKMERESADFAEVLKQAQDLGYAERNPEADIEGHDACRKIAILASLMTGKSVDSEKIPTEGITKINTADFAFAHVAGCTIKLLGRAALTEDGKVSVLVAPFLVPLDNALAMVGDVFNGIVITGNMQGDTLYYGKGAGKLATASAVAADAIECAKNLGKTIPCPWKAAGAALADTDSLTYRFYVRLSADPNALALAKEAFAGYTFLFENSIETYVGLLTAPISEAAFADKCAALGGIVQNSIRMLEA